MTETRIATLEGLFGLAGKRVMVTGASRGLGRCIATAMGSLGAEVVVAARSATAGQAVVGEIEASGGHASFLEIDVGCEQSVVDAFARLQDLRGPVDVLVNNAGIFPTTDLLETTGEEWDEMFRINSRGAFLCLREAAKGMISAERGGRIINFSSMGSLLPAAPSRFAYNASKAAVNRLTQDAAAGLARHGILVNAVLPGPTMTYEIDGTDPPPSKFLEALTRRIPVGRCGAPLDIAGTVVFLAGPASAFMTGQALLVDGGFALGTGK